MFGSLPPKKEMISYIPINTQEYPEILETKKDTRKYPIVYFDTPTQTHYPVFLPISDRILKIRPTGH